MRQAVARGSGVLTRPAASHYDVIALRVAFQPDTSRFTTGDGTFEGTLFPDDLRPVVDPLPHDAAYFGAHLDFLENYVGRVSDGKTTVSTHLIPEVVTVSQTMGAYSPTGADFDTDAQLVRLASLVEEAWTLAGTRTTFDPSGFDPATTAFVLFHAGVGRDVELIGTTLDKTPQDLPSLFFDGGALRRLLGAGGIVFKGMPVENTLVLPRTEVRSGFDFIQDMPFLAEFSINGLLAASFLNYLGVPDLFNTETGESAIGPFGVMDALGIFAFNGLLPPEPGAWTKQYLGWADVETVSGDGPQTLSLTYTSLPATSDVVRVPVSEAEYFLVENRNRDPEADGLVLQVWKDGQVTEQRVANGDPDFNRFITRGFQGGVVVGADDYDWALPGGLDEDDNVLNGGILIWHIDERRLRAGLPDNRVNVDPLRRGVDLEEADGAQDIGFPAQNQFGPAFDAGSPFDFFYRDNPVVVVTRTGQEVRLYQNRFGPDTFPNSNTNEGGASFVVLEDFSAPGPVMTFTYRRAGAEGIAPVTFSAPEDLPAIGGFATGSLLRLVSGGAFLEAYESGGLFHYVDTRQGRSVAAFPSIVAPVHLGNGRFLTLRDEGGGRYQLVVVSRTGEAVVLREVDEPGRPATPLVNAGGAAYVMFEDAGQSRLVIIPPGGAISRNQYEGVPAAVVVPESGGPLVVTSAGVRQLDGQVRWAYDTGPDILGHPVLGRDASGLVGVVPDVSSSTLLVLSADGSVLPVGLAARFGPGTLAPFPVLVDLDGDERLEVLAVYGTRLVALTQTGAVAPGFPIALPATSVAQPLVAELTDSGRWSVLLAGTDGNLYAFDLGRNGEAVPGFPLSAGLHMAATPVLKDGQLFTVSETGALQGWTLPGTGAVWWGELYGAAQNQSFAEGVAMPIPPAETGTLLLPEETYNWPNPIREGGTNLRFMPTQPCRIRITIIDAAGSLIEEMQVDRVPAGISSEVRWDTRAPSGLYFARITASADDGTTESRMIKMAVIR